MWLTVYTMYRIASNVLLAIGNLNIRPKNWPHYVSFIIVSRTTKERKITKDAEPKNKNKNRS